MVVLPFLLRVRGLTFVFGRLFVFISGSAGFTWVDHIKNPVKLIPTVDLGGGIIYFGSFFCLIGEYTYRMAEYFMDDIYIELYEQIFSVGVGFKI